MLCFLLVLKTLKYFVCASSEGSRKTAWTVYTPPQTLFVVGYTVFIEVVVMKFICCLNMVLSLKIQEMGADLTA